MRLLLVGDVHATPEELDDCQRLVEYIKKVATEQQVEYIVFLGDQYHTHAVIRVEVLDFWRRTFAYLSQGKNSNRAGPEIICLVGNHDQPGDGTSAYHALLAHQDGPQLTVVSYQTIIGDILFLPYLHDPQEFLRYCQNSAKSTNLVICHQTFQGADYENGFYAKDGIDPALVPQDGIISGHIHRPQEFGKVWYPGAPRWRSISDANTDRAIWVLDVSGDGKKVEARRFLTNQVCRRIEHRVDTPEAPIQLELEPGHDWRIDIKGPPEWVNQRKEFWKGKAKIRTFPVSDKTPEVRESDGIDVAFQKYLSGFVPPHGTPHEALKQMAQERLR